MRSNRENMNANQYLLGYKLSCLDHQLATRSFEGLSQTMGMLIESNWDDRLDQVNTGKVQVVEWHSVGRYPSKHSVWYCNLLAF